MDYRVSKDLSVLKQLKGMFFWQCPDYLNPSAFRRNLAHCRARQSPRAREELYWAMVYVELGGNFMVVPFSEGEDVKVFLPMGEFIQCLLKRSRPACI